MQMNVNKVRKMGLLLSVVVSLATACHSDNATNAKLPEAPDIEGTYTDGYFENRITADTWTIGTSVFHIKQVDNQAKYLVAQNDVANAYNPNLWSRFDWAISNSLLYVCQTTYDAASEQQAIDTPPANAQDFNTGCGGFPWSTLTPLQDLDAGN